MTSGSRLLVVVALLAACTAAPPPPSASPSASPSPSVPGPTPTDPQDAGFYLRAWYSQALPPEHTFTWAPTVTVVNGVLLDGNVVVPAVFPGPLMISPNARPLSDDGIVAIVDLAEQLGMLGGRTDFTGDQVMPGSRLGQIEIVSDGNERILVGNPELPVSCEGAVCAVDPGTPEAFAAFWQQLSNTGSWLESELGDTNPYVPERVALLLTPPVAGQPGLPPTPVEWPLSTSLEETGVDFAGPEGLRCLTVQDAALDALLPVLQQATQLTVFVDDEENVRSAMVRVLVPREESPCPSTM